MSQSHEILPQSHTQGSVSSSGDCQVNTAPKPQNSSTSYVQNPDPPLSIKESLGIVGISSIAGGYIGIFAIGGLLAFLWFGYGSAPEAANATYAWRQIAIHDWMAQSITLCALSLRFIISLQSTICTSMIASLVLEKHFARRSQVAYFSVLRSVNDGPRKLLGLMISSRTRIVRRIEFWLALLLTAITLALQFTSTILLSDLNDFTIVGDTNRTQAPSLLTYHEDDFDFRLTNGGFVNRLPVYQMFAETLSERVTVPNSNGLSDTGVIIRGFLPLGDSNSRTALRSLDGNLMTMNSRVACMRPVIDAHYETFQAAADTDYRLIKGTLQYSSSIRNAQIISEPACTSPECQELSFECYAPFSMNLRPEAWESVSCLVGGVGGQYWGINLDPKWNSIDAPWSSNSTIQLVFTTNLRRVDWAQVPDEGTLGPSSPYEEWQSFSLVPGRYLNISVCFSAFNMARKSVHVHAEGPLVEPSTNWAITSSEYSTRDVQRYMGVSDEVLSFAERGILAMDVKGEPEDGPPGSPAYANIALNGHRRQENHTIADLTTRVLEELVDYQLTEAKVINTTLLLCYTCDGEANMEHPVIAMLFSSIIAETHRAANAVQSFMTTIAISWYDAYQSSLRELQYVDMVTTKTVRTPGPCQSRNDCSGFYSVVGLLAVHLIYVAVITVMFIRRVRYSRIDNIWHTISQLVGDELRPQLEHGNDQSDKVVKSLSKAQGDNWMQLRKVPDTGRVEVIRYVTQHDRDDEIT